MTTHNKSTPPVTIQVDAEVMEDGNEMGLMLSPDNGYKPKAIQKKMQFVDGPAQRLANLRISIKSCEKKRDEYVSKIKELKAKEKKLVKLMDQIDNI